MAEDETVQSPRGSGGFLTGLLLGGALGAIVALLYAPQGGDQTRDLIKQKTGDSLDLAKSKAGDLTDAAKAKAAEISDKAGDAADSAKAKAAEVTDSVKAKASDASDAVKAKAADTTDSVKSTATDRLSGVKGVIENQKASIAEAVAAGKQAAHDKKEELTASVEADGDMDKDTGAMSAENASKTSASI